MASLIYDFKYMSIKCIDYFSVIYSKIRAWTRIKISFAKYTYEWRSRPINKALYTTTHLLSNMDFCTMDTLFKCFGRKIKTPFLPNPQKHCNMFCATFLICLVAMNHKAEIWFLYCRNCHCHSRIHKTTTHCYPYSCLDTSWGGEYSFFVHIKNYYVDWK